MIKRSFWEFLWLLLSVFLSIEDFFREIPQEIPKRLPSKTLTRLTLIISAAIIKLFILLRNSSAVLSEISSETFSIIYNWIPLAIFPEIGQKILTRFLEYVYRNYSNISSNENSSKHTLEIPLEETSVVLLFFYLLSVFTGYSEHSSVVPSIPPENCP